MSVFSFILITNGELTNKEDFNNFTQNNIPFIEICDPDIAAAEIFNDAPADIRLSKEDNRKLCDMLFGQWWCWMEHSNKQTCCEREVSSSGEHSCCSLNNKGQVNCFTNPKPQQSTE